MTDRQLYILDRFHNELLTPDEQKEYDKFMKTPRFKEAVDLPEDLKVVIEHQRSKVFREKMQTWDMALSTEKPKNRLKYILLAALILLALAFTFSLYKRTQSKPTPELLYAEYAKPYKNIYLPIARSEEKESIEMEAMSAYENRNYQLAIEKFRSLSGEKQVDGIRFYEGVSLFMNDNLKEANERFIQLENVQKYDIPSQWYQFLIALKKQDEQKLKSLGQVLSSQNTHHVLKKNVDEILLQLERGKR